MRSQRVLLSFDEFELDTGRRELRCRGERVRVDPQVVDLLACLAARAGQIVTNEDLIAEVWQGRAVADNVVSVSMAKLRKALRARGGAEPYIVNVYGRGYRFVRAARSQAAAGGERPALPRCRDGVRPVPFVGRDTVLERLRAALERARDGQGGLLSLIGEPGIGKTCTLEALERTQRSHGSGFAWGRVRELEGAPPLWPLVQVLRDVLGRVGRERAQAHLGASFAELGRVLPELGPAPPEAHGPQARHRTYDALLRLLALAGEAEPCVIVLDDLHESDDGTLELLAYLTPELSRLPLLVLATLRAAERPRSETAAARLGYVLGHRNCERIELARLSEGEVSAYTEQVLGRGEPGLGRAVFERSEGNPFFMVELVRSAAEHDGAERLALTLPEPALELMRQRVRKLDLQARGLLSCAAVIGRSFDLGLLGAVTGQPLGALLEQLDEALAGDVLVASSEDPNRFAFGHELMREVLCEALPQSEQRKLRLRVGEALEQRGRSGAQTSAAEIAHHFLAALPEGELLRAVRYARQASDEASAAIAYADAASLLRRALSALELAPQPQPRLRCELLLQLSINLRPFDVPGALSALEQGAATAREHRFGDVLTRVGAIMAPAPGVVTDRNAGQVLRDALRCLPASEIATRAIALAHQSWTGPYCFDREQSARPAGEALACAQAASEPGALANALWAQLYLGGGPQRPAAQTERLVSELQRVSAREPHHARVRTGYELGMFQMIYATQRGDRAGFERALAALDATVQQFGFTELKWHHRRMQLAARMNRGELADAYPELQALHRDAERYGFFAHEMICGHDLLVWALDSVVIDPVPDAALIPARPDPNDPPNVLALKLRTHLDLGQPEVARAILADFSARGIERLPCDRDYLGTLGHLAAAAAALGERPAAQALHDLLAPYAEYFATDVSLHCRGSIAHFLGVLARALGRLPEAVARFEHAVARNDAFGLRLRAADSRYELAVSLSELGGADALHRAAERCAEATAAARTLGMRPLLARAERLAARLRASTP